MVLLHCRPQDQVGVAGEEAPVESLGHGGQLHALDPPHLQAGHEASLLKLFVVEHHVLSEAGRSGRRVRGWAGGDGRRLWLEGQGLVEGCGWRARAVGQGSVEGCGWKQRQVLEYSAASVS